nr:hypothetical protein [Tanacetum cinerariifolium]
MLMLTLRACFFIDGPGGTGKTFLNKALLTTGRSRGLIALATKELSSEPNDDERDSRSGIGKSTNPLSQGGTKNNDSARRDDDGHPDDSTSVEAGCDNLESAILDENDIESEGDDNFYQDFYEQFHSPVINPGSHSVNLRRSTRKTSMPAKLCDLSLNRICNPKSYSEAASDIRKPIDSKRVFKVKYKFSGEVERFIARFVAKGYNQKESIDYEETFSPG